MCGDNGKLFQCGHECSNLVAGLAFQCPTVSNVQWVVPQDCTAPYNLVGSQPYYRSGGITGCELAPNHALLCCP